MKVEAKKFTNSIKRKIIIAFLICFIALFSAWVINRLAFKEMLQTVEKLSSPDDKLKAVNNIFYQIINLDQLQKIKTSTNNSIPYDSISKESKSLQRSLDTLKLLCRDNLVQVQLIDSVKNLLRQRDKVLLNYLDVRKNLINNQSLVKQIDTLGNLITQADKDSIVLTTEHKTLTTTLQSPDRPTVSEQPDKRGLLARIFKKKPKDTVASKVSEQTFVEEQVNTKVDTLVFAQADSTIQKAEILIKNINAKQLSRKKKFENKEAQLAGIERTSIAQVMHILNEVEKDVIRQTSVNSANAQKVVKESAEHTGILMMVFFGITAVLVVLVLTDISKSHSYRLQLQKAKEEAEFHSLARQRFLANMSHEIRTPLQSILGFSELAKQDNSPAKENIDAIYRSSEHLLQIVNEVLDYSRITSGKFTFETRVFDIKYLLNEVILNLRPQAEAKAIRLLLDTDIDDGTMVSGDPFRLKQVLFNLVGNAIKFTEKGSVKMKVKAPEKGKGSAYAFIVEDTGIGIAAENIQAVFNQFEQADSTISNRYGGTGLGLSIVKALVDAQQGKIAVSSQPGKGSCFTVVLPFPAVAGGIDSPPSTNIAPSSSFIGKVWIVDDDNLILKLCSTILSKNNIEHSCFTSAEDLLNEEWDDKVQLVLTDIRLPGKSGIQLCMELKKARGSLNVIALTAQALPEERSVILQKGFDDVLLKPFRERELVALLHNEEPDAEAGVNNGFSLAELEKMTYGDKEQMMVILEQFIEDALDDLDLLHKAIEHDDATRSTLLLHRMAGRIAQIGDKPLGATFRSLEIELDRSGDLNKIKKHLSNLRAKVDALIKTVRQQMQLLVHD